MNLGHTEIFVTDSMKAKEFYENILGFKVEEVQGGEFVWLKRNDSLFLLRPGRKAPTPETYQDAPSALVLYTDDLARTSQELKDRGLNFKGTDGSQNCLTFTDPDGNWFQLVNPKDHS